MTSIGKNAFIGCALSSITIPNSVITIDDRAFSGCPLSSIIVDSGNKTYDSRDNSNSIIETASNTLIVGCKYPSVPNSVVAIGNYAFWECENLKSITIPRSVKTIGDAAFYGCRDLISLNIPNSVISIGNGAFEGCFGLTSIIIPRSVNILGDGAFSDCYGLASVIVLNQKPVSINEETFSSSQKAILYVPAGSKQAYEKAYYWNEFKEIIELALNHSTAHLHIGDQLQLNAPILTIVTGSSVTWSSSDNSIASVSSSGLVTANGEGIVKISATANDGSGVSASCDITVTQIIRGDVNKDERISIADLAALICILNGNDYEEPHQYDHLAADVNEDGVINLVDMNKLLDILLER